MGIWQWDPLPVHCSNNISVHWNNTIGDMQQMKGYNDLICLELDKNKAIVWLTDPGQVFGQNQDIQNQEKEEDMDRYYRPNTVDNITKQMETKQWDESQEDEEYDDEFEEIEDEDIPKNIITKK